MENDIRKRIVNGFAINRIPEKERKWFIQFAKDEFFDDRGMALKHLISVYTGLISSGIEHIEIAVSELRTEVNDLKESITKKTEVEPKKVKKMMNGKTITGDE